MALERGSWPSRAAQARGFVSMMMDSREGVSSAAVTS